MQQLISLTIHSFCSCQYKFIISLQKYIEVRIRQEVHCESTLYLICLRVLEMKSNQRVYAKCSLHTRPFDYVRFRNLLEIFPFGCSILNFNSFCSFVGSVVAKPRPMFCLIWHPFVRLGRSRLQITKPEVGTLSLSFRITGLGQVLERSLPRVKVAINSIPLPCIALGKIQNTVVQLLDLQYVRDVASVVFIYSEAPQWIYLGSSQAYLLLSMPQSCGGSISYRPRIRAFWIGLLLSVFS